MHIWGKRAEQCKCPESWVCLACLRNSRGVSAASAEWMREGVVRCEVYGHEWGQIMQGLVTYGKDFYSDGEGSHCRVWGREMTSSHLFQRILLVAVLRKENGGARWKQRDQLEQELGNYGSWSKSSWLLFNIHFTGTWLRPLALQQHRWVTAPTTVWPATQNMFPLRPFTKNAADP